MSRSRVRGQAGASFIWPGFVDALATLLLIIIFVVLALAAAQVFLSQQIADRDMALADRASQIEAQSALLDAREAELEARRVEIARQAAAIGDLDARVAALAEALNLAEADAAEQAEARRRLTAELAALQTTLDETEAERGRLAGALEDEQAQSAALSADLAAERDALADSQAAAAAAQAEADALRGDLNALAGASGLSADEALLVLAENLAALRDETQRLNQALEAAEAEIEEKNVEIVSLGDRLNRALADKVAELQRYRSAFFGRLREVLGERDDIAIVGDRFLFQAEVLFPPGAATLGAEGEAAIAALVDSVRPLVDDIPDEFDWYLRVDGHTDDRPIATERFASNWALSTARALSVVNQMIALGFPPERLAAAGFGEHRPTAGNDTAANRALNRRIEIVLDQRAGE